MSVQYFYEVSSPSFHTVPHSPFMMKPPINALSPVAVVPDVDTSKTILKKDASYIARQSQLFPNMVNSSPLSNCRVPSVSPRTPINTFQSLQPREQQVPSQTPAIRKKDSSSHDAAPPLDLFTDDDGIFL